MGPKNQTFVNPDQNDSPLLSWIHLKSKLWSPFQEGEDDIEVEDEDPELDEDNEEEEEEICDDGEDEEDGEEIRMNMGSDGECESDKLDDLPCSRGNQWKVPISRKASQTSVYLQEWDIPFEQLDLGELIGKVRKQKQTQIHCAQ